jgi:hypothetical protein
VLFLALLAAAAEPSQATEADIRCVAVYAAAADKADEAHKAGVVAGLMYYIGRIDVRSPGYDYLANLKRLLTDQAFLEKGLPAEAQRCAAEMKAKGSEVAALGDSLAAIGRQESKGQDPK